MVLSVLRLGLRSRRAVRRLAALVLLLTCGLVLAVSLRPDPRPLFARAPVTSSRVLDRNGVRLAELASESGGFHVPVALEQVSSQLIAATLSSEDAHFYSHPGIDPIGVVRAIGLNLRAGRFAYGASTITQQLAKALNPQPRTLIGKTLEALDALRLEWVLDKRAILTEYLNRTYYGRGATGIEAAAERFFGVPASELSLAQASLLAALPRAPSAYDPDRFPERASRRRAHILEKMAERGWVARAAAHAAAARPIVLAEPGRGIRARHVVDYVLQHVERTPRIQTTLDVELQEQVERLVHEHLEGLADHAVAQAGVVVLENDTGEVLAMVGSRDYGDANAHGAVNATTALRAPGSTLKPFVYALALEGGDAPSTAVLDLPIDRRGYRPRSATGSYRGAVTYREALASSLNTPAIRVAERVGPEAVSELLSELGVAFPEENPGLALALGGVSTRLVDLANAYATLARAGQFVPWRLTTGPASPPRRVLSRETAFRVTEMLSDSAARRLSFGVETALDLEFPVAAKTGTSQAFCDNLTVGYTPHVTVAVWVGNFDGRPMRSVLAMTGAAPLFRSVMRLASQGRPPRPFAPPDDLVEGEVCPLSGMLRGPHCPAGRIERVDADHPPHSCSWHGAAGTQLPGELLAVEDHPASEPLPAGHAIVVQSPRDGTRYRIDPLLPRQVQSVPLRAVLGAANVTSIEWKVDGRSLGAVPPRSPATWLLEPGAHQIVAIATIGGLAHRVRSRPTRIVVEES